MSIASEVSPDLLWKHLESICQWERYTGTPGETQTVEYISHELSALGIDVEIHEFDALISIPGKASLDILGETEEHIPAITAVFGASTGEGSVTGDAVYVGEAVAPEGPVAGRIVVAERMLSPGRFFEFEQAGAIGQVYVNMGYAHEMTVSTVWGSPTPESVGRLPATPVVTLSREQGQGLIDLLKTKHEVKLRIHAKTDTAWRKTTMPVAAISPPSGGDEYVLVGGHLDSWHFGANDNGAGDTTLMELARLIHNHRGEIRRGLRVAWWNGHSHGRFSGSTWYADHMFEELRANCAAYLNIDQPGCRQCTIYRPFCTADISAWVKDAVSRLGGQETVPDDPQKMADQSFWGVGVPSFSFLPILPPDAPDLQKDHPESGFPEYWHNPADTIDKMDKDLLAEHTRLYASALFELCTAERFPLDLRPMADVVDKTLADLTGRAGNVFDFDPVVSAANRFRKSAESLAAKADAIGPGAMNQATRKISHALNAALYTQLGPFDHDRASGAQVLPGLQRVADYLAAGPENHNGRVLYTRLVRERNRACAALNAASDIASSV
ncbi:M28 family metallopeptidase [Nitrospinota bacterium]